MSFIVYDLTFLAVFVIFLSVFLYIRRKNLKREGLLLLYRTQWGIKLIEYVGNKYKKSLNILSYISIGVGYILMASILYFFYVLSKIYFFRPDIVSMIKIPPIMPLIPYIDKLVPYLPPFYFTYWIVILAVVAITHEFAHGIFAAYKKIKIKSTGFGFFPFFLPVFLAAFVEPDEKNLVKKDKFSQMAMLSAGTFANVITAVLFFGILWVFFSLSFTPAGVIFGDYSYSIIDVASITMINNISLSNPSYEKVLEVIGNQTSLEIKADEGKYLGVKGISNDLTRIALYNDAPAINEKLELNSAITEINGIKIDGIEKLQQELLKYSPGEKIVLGIFDGEDIHNQDITLGENPENKSIGLIGIGFENDKRSGVLGKIYNTLSSFKKQYIYYESRMGDFGWFIYYLLWWLVLICVGVALMNMLPVGIFDGGRFFYLTVLAITKSEKKAKRYFSIVTYFFLFLLLLLMIFWATSFIR